MKIFLILVLFSFLATGCEKASQYIAVIFPEEKKEETIVKPINALCPPEKPHADVIEGRCDGEWDYDYDSNTQIYTCSYIYKSKMTCPSGTVSIGQPAGCEGQVDQHTKEKISGESDCEKIFKSNIAGSYRLVCCS